MTNLVVKQPYDTLPRQPEKLSRRDCRAAMIASKQIRDLNSEAAKERSKYLNEKIKKAGRPHD